MGSVWRRLQTPVHLWIPHALDLEVLPEEEGEGEERKVFTMEEKVEGRLANQFTPSRLTNRRCRRWKNCLRDYLQERMQKY